jgi:hypothetical protein
MQAVHLLRFITAILKLDIGIIINVAAGCTFLYKNFSFVVDDAILLMIYLSGSSLVKCILLPSHNL